MTDASDVERVGGGPPEAILEAQHQRFNRFVAEYDDDRSHEAQARRTRSELHRLANILLP